MRVMVVGTSGQLATELRRRPRPENILLLDPIKFDVGDVTATRALLDTQAPDLVINASAYTAVDRAEDESERAYAVNQTGPATLAAWCTEHAASLVHVSTDYVFDGMKSAPYLEDDATSPFGVYGKSKLAGEIDVRRLLESHVILRTSWVFSAHGHNFVKTILRLAREKDELRVVGDQRGRPTSAADLADAVLAVAHQIAAGSTRRGTFHFAGSGATSWHGFAEAIVHMAARHTGRTPLVTPISSAEYPAPVRRPPNSVLDTSRFEEAFTLKPRPWADGLGEVIDELC